MKKEPHWDRTKTIADISIDGNSKTSTPRKPRTPKGKKAAAQDDGDDEEQEFDTPSKKKTPLNKVKGSRVTKGSRAKQTPSYAGQDVEDDEEEVDDDRQVKMEDVPVSYNGGSGSGDHEYGHSGYAVTGADESENFYNAAEDYGEEYAEDNA